MLISPVTRLVHCIVSADGSPAFKPIRGGLSFPALAPSTTSARTTKPFAPRSSFTTTTKRLRKCAECESTGTIQWRAGSNGNTLCNKCRKQMSRLAAAQAKKALAIVAARPTARVNIPHIGTLGHIPGIDQLDGSLAHWSSSKYHQRTSLDDLTERKRSDRARGSRTRTMEKRMRFSWRIADEDDADAHDRTSQSQSREENTNDSNSHSQRSIGKLGASSRGVGHTGERVGESAEREWYLGADSCGVGRSLPAEIDEKRLSEKANARHADASRWQKGLLGDKLPSSTDSQSVSQCQSKTPRVTSPLWRNLEALRYRSFVRSGNVELSELSILLVLNVPNFRPRLY